MKATLKKAKRIQKKKKEKSMEEAKKIHKIRVEAINISGLYTKNAMREMYKYMHKRKETTIWILTETHFTKGSELNFKSIYERSFYAFSKRRSWEQRRKHKISKKPSGGWLYYAEET